MAAMQPVSQRFLCWVLGSQCEVLGPSGAAKVTPTALRRVMQVPRGEVSQERVLGKRTPHVQPAPFMLLYAMELRPVSCCLGPPPPECGHKASLCVTAQLGAFYHRYTKVPAPHLEGSGEDARARGVPGQGWALSLALEGRAEPRRAGRAGPQGTAPEPCSWVRL